MKAQLKRWTGYTLTALHRAFIRPIWDLNARLGPLAAVPPVAAAVVVGFITKQLAWGFVGLVSGLLVLAIVSLVFAVAKEAEEKEEARTPTPVSLAHRDALKSVAQELRSHVSAGQGVSETDDDWRAFASYFPDVADQVRHYNLGIAEVERRQAALRNHIGGMVDRSSVKGDRRDMAHDFVVKTITRRAEVPNGLMPPISFDWQEFGGDIQVATDVYPSNLWGVGVSSDPDLSAIKLSVEQMVNDAKVSKEAGAFAQAIPDLHGSENETCRNLDRIGRRDLIVGTCPDCAV
jgi:hypothetical protein